MDGPKMENEEKRNIPQSVVAYLINTKPSKFFWQSMVCFLWLAMAVIGYEAYHTVRNGGSIARAILDVTLELNEAHYTDYVGLQKISQDLLSELADDIGSRNASVFLLHNGKASLGGVPFLKATQFARGRDVEEGKIIEIELSQFPYLKETLDGETIIYNINDYDFSETVGRENIVVVRGPIFNTFSGLPHGWLSITFEEGTEFTAEKWASIQRKLEVYSVLFQTALALSSENLRERLSEQSR